MKKMIDMVSEYDLFIKTVTSLELSVIFKEFVQIQLILLVLVCTVSSVPIL